MMPQSEKNRVLLNYSYGLISFLYYDKEGVLFAFPTKYNQRYINKYMPGLRLAFVIKPKKK